MEQRLSLVSLGVADVPASRAFYERLGWKPAEMGDPTVIVFFQLGGIVLGLYGREALAAEANTTPGNGFPNITLAYNAPTKEAVDATLAEAEKAGATLLKSAADVFWGGYSGYFADPDGHAWEVAWNPHFELRDDGSVVLPG